MLEKVQDHASDEEPSTGAAREHTYFDEGALKDYTREQEWLDEFQVVKLDLLRLGSLVLRWSIRIGVPIAGVLLIAVIVIYAIHGFAPADWRWLSDNDLGRLSRLYTATARISLPALLLVNSWLVFWAGRRKNNNPGR